MSIHGLDAWSLAFVMTVVLSLNHDIIGQVDSNENDCDPSGGAGAPSDDGSGSESNLALHRSRLLPLFKQPDHSENDTEKREAIKTPSESEQNCMRSVMLSPPLCFGSG